MGGKVDGTTEHKSDNVADKSEILDEILASQAASQCRDHFGYEDFDIKRVKPGYPQGCPIVGCATPLVRIPYGKRSARLFCPEHGVRLHSDTFVYWNGPAKNARHVASRRNFPIRADLLSKIALDSNQKAETHRLGSEMSEDALSWNVFAALAEAHKLREVVSFLTDRSVEEEPSLYLWGQLVDVTGERQAHFEPLSAVRKSLENGIGKFKTEPDIMLVVDAELVICIEAKFGSGNPLARSSTVRLGDKPTDREGLLSRYLDGSSAPTRNIVDRQRIGDVFHSQLFRNVVFASEMANGRDWRVVNLSSRTQWESNKRSRYSSYEDPAEHVQSYLREDVRDRFTYRTWEDLHKSLIVRDSELKELDGYMRSKSAHFRRAFVL